MSAIEEAEALDANTPPARLAELMEAHLAAVLKNPGWPLLLLAEPDFWRRLSRRSLFELVRLPRCPAALADWALAHDPTDATLMSRLAANRALPAAVRRAGFLRVSYWLDAATLEASADLLTERELSLLRRYLDPEQVLALAPEDFEALAALGPRGQSMALEHAGCPAEVVARLEPHFPGEAAAHPHLPLARLEALLQSPNQELRCQAARNPSLPQAWLARVAADPATRPELAKFGALTPEWVEAFLRDPDERVRRGLAANLALPETAQRSLALDPSRDVRQALLSNDSLAADVRQLAQRTNRQARARPK